MQRYSPLSSTGSSSHIRSSYPTVGKSSVSSSESAVGTGEGVSLKVSNWQTPSQNGTPLGHFGVKGES